MIKSRQVMAKLLLRFKVKIIQHESEIPHSAPLHSE